MHFAFYILHFAFCTFISNFEFRISNLFRDVAQFGDVSERRRWRMQRGIRSGAIRSIAQLMRARRHITSIASNKVPGHPLEILDFVSGSGSYIATGRALRSGKRSSLGSTKTRKSLQALIRLGLHHFRNFEKYFKKTK